MRKIVNIIIWIVAIGLLVIYPLVSRADEAAEADADEVSAFDKGSALFEARDYEAAKAALLKVIADSELTLGQREEVLFMLGASCHELGNLTCAVFYLENYLAIATIASPHLIEARNRVKRIKNPPPPVVEAPKEEPLPPPATMPSPAEEHKDAEALAKAAEPSRGIMPNWYVWTLGGAALACGVGTVVYGVEALNREKQTHSQDIQSRAEYRQRVDDMESAQTATNVFLLSSAVLGASAGVLWWLDLRESTPSNALSLTPTPSGATLSVAF